MATVTQIQTAACESGIGRSGNVIGLLQAIAQLNTTREGPTPPPPYPPDIMDWLARIDAAGGEEPSADTIQAMEDFLTATVTLSSLLMVNCMVPDSLIACITPLLTGGGYDSWVNSGFTGAAVSVNGMAGNGSDHLETGFIPLGTVASSSAGITMYCFNNPNESTYDFLAASSGADVLGMYYDLAGDAYVDSGDMRIGPIPNAGFEGFLSGALSDGSQELYRASSIVPFELMATDTDSQSGDMPSVDLYLYDANNNGVPGSLASSKTFSFVAVHAALNAAETETLYDAVQAMRTTLGGGYQ